MTIAQSEDSCVVYGMPKAGIERGYAIRVVALDVMSATLQAICGRNDGRSEAGNPGKAMKAGMGVEWFQSFSSNRYRDLRDLSGRKPA